MSTKYRFSENDIPHFVTLTLVEWIDLPWCGIIKGLQQELFTTL
jgi:hypothetical protein